MFANLLTALRLALAMPVALAFAFPGTLAPLTLLSLILVAMLSDLADGKAARHFGTASSRGMLFDHATDFLFVTSALTGLAFAGRLSGLLPALIVIAFAQYALDSYWLHKRKSLRMSLLGRWNGVLYFVPVLLFAAAALDAAPAGLATGLSSLAVLLSWLLIVSSAASIVDRALAPVSRP